MAVVLDATPGSPSANSYASLVDAQTYADGLLYADAWTDADVTDATRTRALITATRILDESVTWLGWPATTTQALAWPRSGVQTRNGATIGVGAIPLALVQATAELARQLLVAGVMPDTPSENPAGIKKIKAGSVEIEFDGAASSGAVAWLPAGVWNLIAFLVATRPSQTSVPLERV